MGVSGCFSETSWMQSKQKKQPVAFLNLEEGLLNKVTKSQVIVNSWCCQQCQIETMKQNCQNI